MSKYVIKQAYKPNTEMHPFAVHLCVSSLLVTLRNGLNAVPPPEVKGDGLLFISSKAYLADTGSGSVTLGGTRVGLERQRRHSLLLIN